MKKILLIDDEKDILKALSTALKLEDEEYEISSAEDGRSGLETARKIRPDLILLDIMLPNLSGIEVCRSLKSDEEYKSIPVIMLTALDQREHIIKGLSSGADDYVTKPFDFPELLARIKANLKMKELHDAAKRSEKEREILISDLNKANAELKDFAYVVSHDLKAPLRAIHNYVDFLQEDLQGRLEEEEQMYLDGLALAVRQSEAFINDLLELSRISRYEAIIENVNIGNFVKELIASLDLPSDVEIVMADDWPAVNTEPVLLRQIFLNLINNAVKFNRSLHKLIELDWHLAGNEHYEFLIRDNGIGIEPRFFEQIFRPFQRLHTAKEFEGTGIGLAIVNKATSRLNGAVRIESTPGKGSTVFVTIPKNLTIEV